MSLAWHVARNDLRRLRWPIVAWVAVIAAKLGVGVLLVLGVGADQSFLVFGKLSVASHAMPVLEALLGYGLVASVVHGDLMVGTTAFWMTRPISGARMLAGKAMGLAVIFGVIPIAVTLPWWLGCSYGVREIGLGAGETLLWQGLVVLVALPLAALTDGLARFLLWSVVVAGVIVGLSAQIRGQPGLLAVAIAVLVFVAGCGVSSSMYFLTRRYLASVAILAVSLALAFGVAVWPWRFSAPARWAGEERPGPLAPNVEFTFREARVRARTGPNSEINVWFQVKGVPPELVLGGLSENVWSWPSPLVLKRDGEVGDMDQGASWIALGLSPPNPTWTGEDRMRTSAYALVPDGFPERVRKDPPSYFLRAELKLVRPVVMGEKPAREGETIATDAEVSRIVHLGVSYWVKGDGKKSYWYWSFEPPPLDPVTHLPVATRRRVLMTLTERGPSFLGRMAISETDSRWSSSWPQRAYFLINRGRGNMTSSGYRKGEATKPVRVGTVAIIWRVFQFGVPSDYDSTNKTWVEQPGWQENLTLAKLKFRTEERFTKELRVDRFTIEPERELRGAR